MQYNLKDLLTCTILLFSRFCFFDIFGNIYLINVY